MEKETERQTDLIMIRHRFKNNCDSYVQEIEKQNEDLVKILIRKKSNENSRTEKCND